MKLLFTKLIAGLLFTPALVFAATINVTTSSDIGPGNCAAPSSCTTLRAAITNAASGDIIQIPSGTIYISSTLQIAKDLTLQGVGSTLVAIDAGNSHRTIQFSANSLIINDIQIQNSSSADGLGGAGLLIQTGSVTINRSTFTGNSSTTMGGAINNYGSLSVNRSTFFNNHSPSGAAIAIGSASSATLYYSSIVNNTSTTGAIDNAGILTAEGSLFHNPVDCAGTGNTLSLGYNLEASRSCSFTTGTLTPDYANVIRLPVASVLSDYGKTQTLSPDITHTGIIDQGPSTCTGEDQKGTPVPQNVRCDIGAIEMISATPPSTGTIQNGFGDDDRDDEGDSDHEDDDDESNGIGAFDGYSLLLLLILTGLLCQKNHVRIYLDQWQRFSLWHNSSVENKHG